MLGTTVVRLVCGWGRGRERGKLQQGGGRGKTGPWGDEDRKGVQDVRKYEYLGVVLVFPSLLSLHLESLSDFFIILSKINVSIS